MGNPAEENVPSPGSNPTSNILEEPPAVHHQTNRRFPVSQTPTPGSSKGIPAGLTWGSFSATRRPSLVHVVPIEAARASSGVDG